MGTSSRSSSPLPDEAAPKEPSNQRSDGADPSLLPGRGAQAAPPSHGSDGARRASPLWRSPFLWRSYLVTGSLIGVSVLIGGWQGALAAMGIGAVLLYWSIRSVIHPLASIASAAEAMARGSYEHRISATQSDEAAISSLGRALNSLSGDLAQRFNAIAEDRDRLETVLAATLEGVIALDREGRVTLLNQAAQRLLSLAPHTTIGRPLRETCRNLSLVNLAQTTMEESELRNSEVKEAGKTLEVYVMPLKEGTGAVLVVHDVTEVRRLETVRRDFVANVSHELKTPLTSIRAYLETLLEGGGIEDPDNNVRFLKKIELHVNRLTTLITDLLSLSRIESGDAFSQRQRINLTELVSSSYQRLAPNAETKEIALRFHPEAAPVHAMGDTEAFHQIFDNLIDNAVKYTEAGGAVDIFLRKEGPRVRVDVKDTGVGIPKEDLPRIFERFYRVDKARSRELGGTGLGLSIVKHLLQALEGEIRVESEVGKGSTFSVWFNEG